MTGKVFIFVIDKVTISGLATGDYQPLSDLEIPEFVHSHLKPIPQELRDQLNSKFVLIYWVLNGD